MRIIDIIVPHLKEDTAKAWIAEAVPTIIAGGPTNISRTIDVRLNEMIDDLKEWDHNDMWKGVVPQRLVHLLLDLGMKKREIHRTAREITTVLENTAMDLWILTNAIRKRAPLITEPEISLQEKTERLDKAGMLGYSMQQIKSKHIEHANATLWQKGIATSMNARILRSSSRGKLCASTRKGKVWLSTQQGR